MKAMREKRWANLRYPLVLRKNEKDTWGEEIKEARVLEEMSRRNSYFYNFIVIDRPNVGDH